LSRRTAARFLARFIILGAGAASLAGVSAYAMRPAPNAAPGLAPQPLAAAPQVSNAAAKADRLAVLVREALTYSDLGPTYTLASVTPAPDFDRFYDAVTRAVPMHAEPPLPRAEPAQPDVAAVPMPPRRPKLPPPPALLDDAQLAGIKGRLRLTAAQAEYWPAVEAALRELARTQLREGQIRYVNGQPNIDVNSPEVQQLIWAAMPLLRQLREDQKREVRQLVRVIGLGAVAAHI
jgi:hypothetical protein